jgi:hypothetical protein
MRILINRMLLPAGCLVMATSNLLAQVPKAEDPLLISSEQQKWKALKTGSLTISHNWYAEDFVSIGYMPDGKAYQPEKRSQEKPAIVPNQKQSIINL